MRCFVLAHVLRRNGSKFNHLPNHSAQLLGAIKNKPYNAIVRSETDSKTLSSSWPQPDPIEISSCTLNAYFFEERGVVSTRVSVVLQTCETLGGHRPEQATGNISCMFSAT